MPLLGQALPLQGCKPALFPSEASSYEGTCFAYQRNSLLVPVSANAQCELKLRVLRWLDVAL